MDDLKYFVPITKRDDEQRMVWGLASTPSLDSQGDRITADAIREALPGYMRFANVREMHQLSAVGKTLTAAVDETGLNIGAKIVDDTAWAKVKAGVYNGFSVGGKVTTRDKESITGINLVEISLVDRPANPECVFDVWKAETAATEYSMYPIPPEQPKPDAPVVEAAQEEATKVATPTMGDDAEYVRRCALIGIDHSRDAIRMLMNPYIN